MGSFCDLLEMVFDGAAQFLFENGADLNEGDRRDRVLKF